MAYIKEYLPKMFDLFEPKVYEFKSQDDLLELPFVKRFRVDHEGNNDKIFYRYSFSEPDRLIVEACGGDVYYIIGFLSGDYSFLNLPKWEQNEEDTKRL